MGRAGRGGLHPSHCFAWGWATRTGGAAGCLPGCPRHPVAVAGPSPGDAVLVQSRVGFGIWAACSGLSLLPAPPEGAASGVSTALPPWALVHSPGNLWDPGAVLRHRAAPRGLGSLVVVAAGTLQSTGPFAQLRSAGSMHPLARGSSWLPLPACSCLDELPVGTSWPQHGAGNQFGTVRCPLSRKTECCAPPQCRSSPCPAPCSDPCNFSAAGSRALGVFSSAEMSQSCAQHLVPFILR